MTPRVTLPAIGVVGNDVPRQLVLAAGALPVRLAGGWDGAVDDDAADLLGAADLEAARILTALRRGEFRIDALIVCNDSQAHLRLYYVLRATPSGLRVHLLDLPREDSQPARAFVQHQFAQLLAFCEDVSGRTVDAESLASAGRAERDLGRALDRLRQRRRAVPSRCTGADALDAYLQAGRLDPAEAVRRIDATGCAEGSVAPSAPGTRVHLTGSNHPDASVYRRLEDAGYTIVSEDHDTGDGAWIGTAADGADVTRVIDGLVQAHFGRTTNSATALAAERARLTVTTASDAQADVVTAFIRELDDAPRWDLADQRVALAREGLPLVAREHVPADPTVAVAELADALRKREVTVS